MVGIGAVVVTAIVVVFNTDVVTGATVVLGIGIVVVTALVVVFNTVVVGATVIIIAG